MMKVKFDLVSFWVKNIVSCHFISVVLMQAREEDFAEFKYESKKSEVSAIQE